MENITANNKELTNTLAQQSVCIQLHATCYPRTSTYRWFNTGVLLNSPAGTEVMLLLLRNLLLLHIFKKEK